MTSGQKRADKQLKTQHPGGRKAKKSAGAKYLQQSLADAPSVSKIKTNGRKP